MTVDEDLNKLEDDLRRLKVEYEVYFNGGTPRPPQDTAWRVDRTIKKYSSDSSKMNFGQRFKFQSLQQKYAVHHELWRKKLKEKEEGRGRYGAPKVGEDAASAGGVIRVVCSDPENEKEKVDQLLKAMVEAKRQVGERVDNIDPMAFTKWVSDKTKQIRESLGCDRVQFSVSVDEGKVKLKAVKAE